MQAWDERPTSLVGEAGEQIKGVRRQGVLECQPTREGGAGEAGEQIKGAWNASRHAKEGRERRESRIKSLHGRARATIGGRAVSPAYTDLLAFVRGAAPGHSCICSRLCALPSSIPSSFLHPPTSLPCAAPGRVVKGEAGE